MTPIFGAIEAGGTKFVCMVGSGPDDVVDLARFPTTSPAETLDRVLGFFRQPRPGVSLAAIGVASFGPIDLNPESAHYGKITTTPKKGMAIYRCGRAAPRRIRRAYRLGHRRERCRPC